MFTQLLASRPAHQRSAPQVATSVVLHGALLIGAVYGTTRLPQVIEPSQSVVIGFVPDDPPPPPATPLPPTTVAAPNTPSIALGAIDIANALPPITVAQIGTPPPATGSFVPGPFLLRPPAAPARPASSAGSAFRAEEVEEQVAIDRGSPLPRFPSALRAAGIEGDVRVRFVVDTLGRVEMRTVEPVSSSNGSFALAVLETLPRMRFRPARIGGRAVRQLVEFPVTFRISK